MLAGKSLAIFNDIRRWFLSPSTNSHLTHRIISLLLFLALILILSATSKVDAERISKPVTKEKELCPRKVTIQTSQRLPKLLVHY